MTIPALAKLNSAYMRVARRIAGDSRFSSDVEFSDLQIRQRLQVVSIDCHVLSKRLLYYGRVAERRPPLLWALLQSRPGDQDLPYIVQFRRDIAEMCKHVLETRAMPALEIAPQRWFDIMANDRTTWSKWVHSIHFTESVLDWTQQLQCRLGHSYMARMLRVVPVCEGIRAPCQEETWFAQPYQGIH